VFSSAAKNIDRDSETVGYFDRMVFADDGCSDRVIAEFNEFIKERGQDFLEELDVWFTSRKEESEKSKDRKETGVYMVHYVEDADDLGTLQELLQSRGQS
ncbi:MAG: hypothetical protein HKP05_05990, partial [Woeseiaceae bacterium]|nr:hypothetical protein [Gammaproteobacteria bacterium]NNK25190.1 hypothetical protein [Woeseiaceae bacterium]